MLKISQTFTFLVIILTAFSCKRSDQSGLNSELNVAESETRSFLVTEALPDGELVYFNVTGHSQRSTPQIFAFYVCPQANDFGSEVSRCLSNNEFSIPQCLANFADGCRLVSSHDDYRSNYQSPRAEIEKACEYLRYNEGGYTFGQCVLDRLKKANILPVDRSSISKSEKQKCYESHDSNAANEDSLYRCLQRANKLDSRPKQPLVKSCDSYQGIGDSWIRYDTCVYNFYYNAMQNGTSTPPLSSPKNDPSGPKPDTTPPRNSPSPTKDNSNGGPI